MAIEDGIIGRLQRIAGDASPVNTITSTEFTSYGSGTVSQVTQGGELAWRFQGDGAFKSVIPSITATGSTGPCTIAIRCIVGDIGAAFDTIAGLGLDSTSGATVALRLQAQGRPNCGMVYTNQGTQALGVDPRSAVTTYVINANIISGTDNNRAWLSTGATGDSPDATSGAYNANSRTYDTMQIGDPTISDYDITILDFVAWDRTLSDAEARLVATNIRTQLPTAGVSPVTFNGTISNQSSTVETPFNLGVSSFFTGTQTPFAYTITTGSLPSGLTLNSATGLIIGTPNMDDPQTGIIITATDSDLATASSNSFDISVDTTSWGLTRQQIEDSDNTNGSSPPFLVNDFDAGDAATDRFRFTIDTQPSSGILTVNSSSSGVLRNAVDGVYTATYTGYKNGVSYGSATITFNVGSMSTLNLSVSQAANQTLSMKFFNDNTNTYLGEMDVVFSNGSASIDLPIGSGMAVHGRYLGSNPPVTGTGIYGVTT